MATIETDASINQSVAELRAIRRHAQFTNVMASIAVCLLAISVNRDLTGICFYLGIAAAGVALALR